jgi:hypothetical protein
MRVLGFSVVCNVARPDAPTVNSHKEVLDAAKHAEPFLRKIVLGVLETENQTRRSSGLAN